MKTRKILLLVVLATYLMSGMAFARHGGQGSQSSVAGEFDSYVFSLSWQPAFCETKPDKKECASQTPDRYDAMNLALHGLWPNENDDKKHTYGYCGVKSSVRKLDKASTWCQMPPPVIEENTKKQLAIFMPGYASCLERHEWYKHGTCSGLEGEKYFVTAYTLVARMADTSFGKYLSEHVGQSVASGDLLAEFEKDFGNRDFVTLQCVKIHGVSMLSEVRLYLKKDLDNEGDLKEMLILLDNPDKGNCPQKFLIDKVQ